MSAADGTYDPSRSGARIDQDEILGQPPTPPELIRFYLGSEGRYPRMEFAPEPSQPVADWQADVEHNVQEWTEVRIVGQPDGGYPPYDFTFRSDQPHWADRERLIRAAGRNWTGVTVTHRTVRRETWSSPWRPAPIPAPPPCPMCTNVTGGGHSGDLCDDHRARFEAWVAREYPNG